MSAVALIGSLEGGGTFTLENGGLVRLDPAAFDAVIRAVDQRPADRRDQRSGQHGCRARERSPCHRAGRGRDRDQRRSGAPEQHHRARPGRRSRGGGSVDLADGALEARLLLFGSGGAGAPLNTRPEVTIA